MTEEEQLAEEQLLNEQVACNLAAGAIWKAREVLAVRGEASVHPAAEGVEQWFSNRAAELKQELADAHR